MPSAARLSVRDAYHLARAHLEEAAEHIWDWDEDVSVLNCARVTLA